MAVARRCRKTVADVPRDRWLGHVIEVCDSIRGQAAADATIQVPGLPWHLAETQRRSSN